MKKLITVVFICTITLLFSGCGTAGFSIGLAYNEWSTTITFSGQTPTLSGAAKEASNTTPQQ